MRPLLARTIVFVTSGAVLVLETLAGRLLAPYLGVTLETFTGIIGVVLAGIAVGTWLGGRMADKWPPQQLLGPLLAIGGTLSIASIPIITVVGAANLGRGPVAITLLTLVGFFLPSAVLSAVSPTVVKVQLQRLEETGEVVGTLSAVGTTGSLVGTFLTGFVLVAKLPTRTIVIALGAALVIAGVALWYWIGRGVSDGADDSGKDGDRAQRIIGVAILIAMFTGGLGTALPTPCDVESPYFCAVIVHDPDRPSGRTLILDGMRNSYVDIDDPTYLEFTYAQTMSDVLDTFRPPGEPIDAVHIGGGAFTLPRYIEATRPGSESIVFELDPTLIEIGQTHFALALSDQLQVQTGDARTALVDVPDATADVVIGDAFSGQAVPWHLTTVEFLDQIHRVLRPEGVYLINVIDYPPLGFVRAEVATLQTVFNHVALIAPPERVAGEQGGNFIVAASDEPIDDEAVRRHIADRDDTEIVVTDPDLTEFVGETPVLTDNYAPVDQLLTPLQ